MFGEFGSISGHNFIPSPLYTRIRERKNRLGTRLNIYMGMQSGSKLVRCKMRNVEWNGLWNGIWNVFSRPLKGQ